MQVQGLHISEGRTHEAALLVGQYHYSHKLPAGMSKVIGLHASGGLFGDLGPMVACVCFGPANVYWESSACLELRRMVRVPDVAISLSGLVAVACRLLRSQGLPLLISYADPEHGHHGGVYQACSWHYAGPAGETRGGFAYDGRVYHRRAWKSYEAFVADVARGDAKRCEIVHVTPKHLYWKALTRKGAQIAKERGLASMPYPKPGLP